MESSHITFFGPLLDSVSTWSEEWRTLAVFAAAFLLEDVAVVGAGLLVVTGQLSWVGALGGAFLGVWGGDVGLYFIARVLGRRVFDRFWLVRHGPRLARAEELFGRHGTKVLVFSRMLPGARLPTYLVAGFLRLDFARFGFVTACAALGWTSLIIGVTCLVGKEIRDWVGIYQSILWILLFSVILVRLSQSFGKSSIVPEV